MLRKITLANAYALIASVFGLFFLVATPPFGVGDETAHFERAYEIATGAYAGADGLPSGMQTLIDDAFGRVKSGEAFTPADFARLSAIDLNAQEITPWPEPVRAVLRLHSPLCYIHLAPIAAAGLATNAPPLVIFLLGRFSALIAGVFLVRAAIARAPAQFRPALVFIGLLPTTIVYFGAFNIESLVVGLGFYYFAMVASLAADGDAKLTRAQIAQLVAVAFILGQFKTGYLLLPAAALLLPASKFPSRRARVATLTLIIIPGAIFSLGWAMVVKNEILGGIIYSTMDGNHVEPAAQLAGIFANPLGYLATIWRTMASSDALSLAWRSFLGLGGWTNIPLSPLAYAMLTLGFLLVWMSGDKPPRFLSSPTAVALQLAIVGATVFAILTLVYLQWNGVGSPVISGFQGRYFLAVAPLILAAAPFRFSFLANSNRRAAMAFAIPVLGLTEMIAATLDQYYY